MKGVHVKIDDKLYERLKREAERRVPGVRGGMKVVIVEALREHLEKRG